MNSHPHLFRSFMNVMHTHTNTNTNSGTHAWHASIIPLPLLSLLVVTSTPSVSETRCLLVVLPNEPPPPPHPPFLTSSYGDEQGGKTRAGPDWLENQFLEKRGEGEGGGGSLKIPRQRGRAKRERGGGGAKT